jgi:ubiquinone/menaquinone biosynthesis C-methylase UbiE
MNNLPNNPEASAKYLEINKNCWDTRLNSHIQSSFYDLEGFKKGKSSLNPLELDLLGPINGKKILHLQCHFGQDTLSLARLGAEVTGVDFSEKAIEQAKDLAQELHLPARFICSDVYALDTVLNEKFDIVYTSYGVIGWLPDMTRWAEIIRTFLKPEGELVFIEFHPIVWMLDNDFTHIAYPYQSQNPIIETLEGTYADQNATITTESISWNHGIGEVMGALMQQGLEIRHFEELFYSHYACFSKTVEIAPGKYQIPGWENIIPLMYAIKAQLP